MLRSRGPLPRAESDFDGFRLFEGLGAESKVRGGTELKSFVSSEGTFSIDCTVITNLRHGICSFLLKDGVGAVFDKEIDGAVWKPVGKIATEVRRIFDPKNTGKEFIFVDSTQSVAFYSSKNEIVLKIKSK